MLTRRIWTHVGSYRYGPSLVVHVLNRRFFFTVAALCLISSKIVHVYSHIDALTGRSLGRWIWSFFLQDTILLICMRLMVEKRLPDLWAWLRPIILLCTFTLFTYVSALGVVSVSFFLVSGVEIHWRNMASASDPANQAILLTGLASFLLVLGSLLVLSWACADLMFFLTGMATDLVTVPVTCIWSSLRRCTGLSKPTRYFSIAQYESEIKVVHASWKNGLLEFFKSLSLDTQRRPILLLKLAGYLTLAGALLAQIILTIIRPSEASFTFMSWTPILLPFVDFSFVSSALALLPEVHHSSIGYQWDNKTALHRTPPFQWLPLSPSLAGFENWQQSEPHYTADGDPLKISNLDEDLISDLRGQLANVEIRHIVLILLESTRKDIFPLKKNSFLWNRLAETYGPGGLPAEAVERLSNLTRNANFITGDYDDGFDHDQHPRRGGISFNNAYTTGTYTLKSVVGTLCGITPLAADFNMDYNHHIYQPCLPHVLEAFNTINPTNHESEEKLIKKDYTQYPWVSTFMQSVTLNYNKFYELMLKLGYTKEHLIDKEYLISDDAKFGKVDLPDINYFGFQETPLEDYMSDEFKTAKKNNGRVFLTHITSTSHHAFRMPDSEPYIEVAHGEDELSHYVNAIGYDDKWIGRVLDVLEEEGVANETLVVFLGDHGVSLPENSIASPYYNPLHGVFNVPMVLSHPHLPSIEVDDAVNSEQLLPTILDLLLETHSLSTSASQAAKDLMHNYEGQSLIRPHRTSSAETQQGDWHFTIINPGGAMLALRDARQEYWRLVVPLIANVEWHFTDLSEDRPEAHPVLSFDFYHFLNSIEALHGVEAARWAEEGAFIARWWIGEHHKRWRFTDNVAKK